MYMSSFEMLHWVLTVFLLEKSSGSYLDTLQSKCPYTNLCTVNATLTPDVNDDIRPCCTPCSCDKDCWIVDNCCPDVLHSKPANIKEAKCTSLIVNTDLNSSLPIGAPLLKYRVIDFCPLGAQDQQMIDYCEGKYGENVQFSDVVAVSDGNYRIYKNKYCAMCHGVQEFISWNMTMACPEDFPYNNITTTNIFRRFMENCQLLSVPPRILPYDGFLRSCHPVITDSCSTSAPIDEIQRLCEQGPGMLYFRVNKFGITLLYKNIFCYQCSSTPDDFSTVNTDCVDTALTSRDSYFGHFTLILDLQFTERSSEATRSMACSESDVYNYVKKTCTKLFCPPLSVPLDGSCRRFAIPQDYMVKVQVLFRPIDSLVVSEDMDLIVKDSQNQHAWNVLTKIGLHNCNLYMYTLKALVEIQSHRLSYCVAELSIKINSKCQLSDIAEILKKHYHKKISSSIPIGSSTIVQTEGQITLFRDQNDLVQADFDDYGLYLQRMFIYIENVRLLRRLKHLKQGFFLCPYFALSIGQYNVIVSEVFGDKGLLINLTTLFVFTRIQEGFYALSENEIAVCVETYFELYNRNGHQSDMAISHILKVVVFSSIAAFITFLH